MHAYEATATVEDQGDIRVSGVPFQPGTKVEVTITPIQNGAEDALRTELLLAALDKGRNSEPVGPLNRAALYDRAVHSHDVESCERIWTNVGMGQ